MHSLTSPDFWRVIAWSLVRTALAGLVPFLPGLTSDLAGSWPLAAGTVGLLLIVTVATSLSGIATPDTAPWWQVLMSRGLRQAGQFFAAGLVGAVVLSDVNWVLLLQGTLASALSTVVLAALTIIPGDQLSVGPYVPQHADETWPPVDYDVPDGADPGDVDELRDRGI